MFGSKSAMGNDKIKKYLSLLDMFTNDISLTLSNNISMGFKLLIKAISWNPADSVI